MGGWAPEPMRLGMDGSSTTNRKKMPRGYCGFVGENLGTKHLESFAASLKMLHLFDNLGLVDIILYICILCVYIYIYVCGCVCAFVFMFEPCRNWETFYTIHKFFCGVADHGHCSLFHSGLLSFYFDLFRSCSDSDAHIPILIYIIIVHFVICIYI